MVLCQENKMSLKGEIIRLNDLADSLLLLVKNLEESQKAKEELLDEIQTLIKGDN